MSDRPESAQTPRFCESCGAPLPAQGAFCEKCGRKAPAPAAPAAAASAAAATPAETAAPQGEGADAAATAPVPPTPPAAPEAPEPKNTSGIDQAATLTMPSAARPVAAQATGPMPPVAPAPAATQVMPQVDPGMSGATTVVNGQPVGAAPGHTQVMPGVAPQPANPYQQQGGWNAAAPAPQAVYAAPAAVHPGMVQQPGQRKKLSQGAIVAIVLCSILAVFAIVLTILAIARPDIPWLAGTPFSSAHVETQEQREKRIREEEAKKAEETQRKIDQAREQGRNEGRADNNGQPTVNIYGAGGAGYNFNGSLYDAWTALGALNTEVVNEANWFNQNWKRGGNHLSECRNLAARIDSFGSSLGAMSVPSGLEGKKSLMLRLTNDLSKRIGVLVEAWELAVRHAPESEVLRPLGRDNNSSGVNRYKIDFDNNYQAARP